MKSLKDVKPGDKIFVLNSNRGYLKEPQIEILTVNKVGILYIYTDYDKYKKSNGEAVESSLDVKAFAKLYVYDALKKKITILTNIQKGKDINVDIFLPKVTDVTVSDFAKYLQKAIESQPEEERAKHRKFFGEPISFCTSVLVEEFNSEVKKIKENYEV